MKRLKNNFILLIILFFWLEVGQAIDLDNGEEINEVCAGCHGEFGQGGKQGAYPRLAGQPATFIAKQLHLFRTRKRQNLPMVSYTEERELPDEDILDISAYLSQITLATRLPPQNKEKKFDAFERLMQAKKVLNIARAKGNVETGKKLYNRQCRSCHGHNGWGKKKRGNPMIAGQYTNYLWRQITKFINKERIHDEDEPDDDFLKNFTHEELENIFAYLSIVDD
jgi:cytochrome c553